MTILELLITELWLIEHLLWIWRYLLWIKNYEDFKAVKSMTIRMVRIIMTLELLEQWQYLNY